MAGLRGRNSKNGVGNPNIKSCFSVRFSDFETNQGQSSCFGTIPFRIPKLLDGEENADSAIDTDDPDFILDGDHHWAFGPALDRCGSCCGFVGSVVIFTGVTSSEKRLPHRSTLLQHS
jgi:hypothetical protein